MDVKVNLCRCGVNLKKWVGRLDARIITQHQRVPVTRKVNTIDSHVYSMPEVKTAVESSSKHREVLESIFEKVYGENISTEFDDDFDW